MVIGLLYPTWLNRLRWIITCTVLSKEIRQIILSDNILLRMWAVHCGWKRIPESVLNGIDRIRSYHCRECLVRTRAYAVTTNSRIRIRLCTECAKQEGYSRLIGVDAAEQEYGLKRRLIRLHLKPAKIGGNRAHLFWAVHVQELCDRQAKISWRSFSPRHLNFFSPVER